MKVEGVARHHDGDRAAARGVSPGPDKGSPANVDRISHHWARGEGEMSSCSRSGGKRIKLSKAISCEPCRRSKVKCDRRFPCNR